MRRLLVLQWFVVVALHVAVVAGNLAAFFVLPFFAPWYVALPVCSFIFRLALVGESCPLTDLENVYREKLSWKPIRTFIGHYMVKHLRRLWTAVLAR